MNKVMILEFLDLIILSFYVIWIIYINILNNIYYEYNITISIIFYLLYFMINYLKNIEKQIEKLKYLYDNTLINEEYIKYLLPDGYDMIDIKY
jgi:cell shape-determining protein MreC